MCSLGDDLTPANDNINQIKRLRERERTLPEANNVIPTEIKEETNKTMTTGGE